MIEGLEAKPISDKSQAISKAIFNKMKKSNNHKRIKIK